MGKIISIANQKGGVGKTTTTINLCSCLAKAGKVVLMVDMDPQANATSGVGGEIEEDVLSVYDGLLDGENINNLILETDYKNFFLLPANYHLTGAEIELTSVENREFKLKELLYKIKNKFDYIIIDCPPTLGLLTLNALCASDSILIPLQAEYFALEGISQLMSTYELVKEDLNKTLELEGILMTMCDVRTNLAKQVVKEAKNYFKDKVYKTIIPRNIKLAEAPSYGKPIVYYDLRSIGAEKYLSFTEEFLKKN